MVEIFYHMYFTKNSRSGEIKILFNKTDVKDNDSQYVLIVKDNGIGIPRKLEINESGSSWLATRYKSGAATGSTVRCN